MIDDTLTIRARSGARSSGRNASIIETAPNRLVSNVWRNRAASTTSVLAAVASGRMPALLTSTSSRPWRQPTW